MTKKYDTAQCRLAATEKAEERNFNSPHALQAYLALNSFQMAIFFVSIFLVFQGEKRTSIILAGTALSLILYVVAAMIPKRNAKGELIIKKDISKNCKMQLIIAAISLTIALF